SNTTSSPVSGVSPNYWVRFTVTEQIPTLFSAVLGMSHTTVSARATAGAFTNAAGACIYSLDPTADGAISLVGNTDVEAGCGVWDDSTAGDSLSCTNNTT